MEIIFYLYDESEKDFICNSTDTDLSVSKFVICSHLDFSRFTTDIAGEEKGLEVVVSEKLLEQEGLLDIAPDDGWGLEVLKSTKYKLGRRIDEYCREKGAYYEDLAKYIYFRSVIQISDYPDQIDTFIPSKDMAEYLKRPIKSCDSILDIIYHAPCCLQKKLEGLKQVRFKLENSIEYFLRMECDELISNIEKAMELIDEDGVFSLEPACFEDNNHDSDSYFEGVYGTWNDVNEFVRANLEDCEIKDTDLWWYEATKWIKGEQGKYVKACAYIIVGGELWYIDLEDAEKKYCSCDFYDGISLNLPVPFKAGDIVEYDGYPFTPKQRILIANTGDNLDCCSLQSIHWDYHNNYWSGGAVKHGFLGIDMYPGVSALYTMHRFGETLDESEEILRRCATYIDGDEDRGEKLEDRIYKAETSDLSEILNELEAK